MNREPETVSDVLSELDELATAHDEVRIADVLDDFGKRSFGPFIMIPALIELSPVGGIPGLPTVLATIIAMIALQLVLGRDHVWMPGFIQRRAIAGKKLHRAVGKLRGVAGWLDRHSKRRLEFFVGKGWSRIAAMIVIALCCTVPPLEFVPFASSMPMLAIAMLGMALTVRDGALTLAAIAFSALATGIAIYLYATSDGTGGGSGLF